MYANVILIILFLSFSIVFFCRYLPLKLSRAMYTVWNEIFTNGIINTKISSEIPVISIIRIT